MLANGGDVINGNGYSQIKYVLNSHFLMDLRIKMMPVSGRSDFEESGEKWREIWQQKSGGVAGREYLSGWHSNAVSINVPGHLLNQATAGRLEDIQLSLSSNGHSVPQKHRKTTLATKTTAEGQFGIRKRFANDTLCRHVVAGESLPLRGGKLVKLCE